MGGVVLLEGSPPVRRICRKPGQCQWRFRLGFAILYWSPQANLSSSSFREIVAVIGIFHGVRRIPILRNSYASAVCVSGRQPIFVGRTGEWLFLLVWAAILITNCGGCGGDGIQPSQRMPASPPGVAPIGAGGMGLDQGPSGGSPSSPATPAPAKPAPAPAAGSPAPSTPAASTPAASTPAPSAAAPAAAPGKANPPKSSEVAARLAALANPKAAGAPAGDSKGAPAGDSKGAGQSAAGDGPLPDDISQWRRDQYYQARKTHDKRLIEAVMYLGEHFAGSSAAESAATLLANLLKPDKPANAAAPGTPAANNAPTEVMAPELIKAIIYALGATKTTTGRETLKQVIAGTYGIENDRVAAGAALEALGFYKSPENEDVLLTVLTQPETFRKLPPAPSPAAPAAAVVPPGAKAPEAPKEKPSPNRPPGFVASSNVSTPVPTPAVTAPAPAPSPAGREEDGNDFLEKRMKRYNELAGKIPTAQPIAPAAAGQPAAKAVYEKMSALEMQTLAWNWIRQSASRQTRTKLAQYLQRASLPGEIQPQCMQLLEEPNPANTAAQLILYQSPRTQEATRTALFGQLTRYSSESLGAILGIPSGVTVPPPPASSWPTGAGAEAALAPGGAGAGAAAPRPASSKSSDGDNEGLFGRALRLGGGLNPTSLAPAAASQPSQPSVQVDANTGYQLAGTLWSTPFAANIQGNLARVTSLRNDWPQVMMASTMPLDATRAALFKVFKKYSEEGPEAIGTSALFKEIVFEPGFLAVVKLMPRKDRPVTTSAPGGTSRPSTRSARAGMKAPPSGATPPEPSKQDQVPQEWMRISEGVLRALCARLKAAGGTDVPKDLPFELHPSARVKSSFHFEWPTEAAKKLAGVSLDPMRVHYLCLEQKGRPSGVLAFYKHRITTLTVHELEKDIWADSFRSIPGTDSAPPRRQSLDVLITLPETVEEPGSTPQASKQQREVDLVVEVLSIELNDPNPPEARTEAKR